MVIIGDASPSDLDGIYEIEKGSFDDPYPLGLLKAYLFISNGLFIVARSEKVLGYALGIVQSKNRGHVISIAVDPSFRGEGIGRSLLGELHRRFLKLGCSYSYLEVAVTNTEAIELYRAMQYKVVRFRVGYYGKGKHAFVMVKDLRERVGIC